MYGAPVVGYVDGLGYYYCPGCRPVGRESVPVDGGNAASEGERCDSCGTVTRMVPVAEYVPIG